MKNPFSKFFGKLAQLNWLNYLLEFIIVFLGITIAFYINQRAEAQKVRSQEDTYLDMIVADLEKDSVDHNYIIQFYRNRLWPLEIANHLLENSNAENVDSIILYSLSLVQTSNYHPDVKTYHSLVENGEILKIEDLELRRRMADYYAYFNMLEDRHDEAKNAKKSELKQFLNQYYDFWSNQTVNQDAFLSLELKNILHDVRAYEIDRIKAYEKALRKSVDLKAHIRKSKNHQED